MEKNISIKSFKDESIRTLIKTLYQLIVTKVSSYPGMFIDTQNKDEQKDNMYADVLELGGVLGEERIGKYIYGIRVVNGGELEIATEYVNLEKEKPVWGEEEFKNAHWQSIIKDNTIINFPTICCIADVIEQY